MVKNIIRSTIKFSILGVLSLSFLMTIGTVILTLRMPDMIINVIEHFKMSPTPTAWTIKGLGIIGDSQSDEYQTDDNRGVTYASTTFNWVEILQHKRNINLGEEGTWDEPRRSGYEYNWARTGATTLSMLESGQHTGVADQVKSGKVNVVIIYMGANDFAPSITPDDYQAIYSGELSDARVLQKINRIVADMTTAVDTIQEAGNVRLLLVKIPDWDHHVGIQVAFPLPNQRQRVSDAIQLTNEKLEKMAQERQIQTVDPNDFYTSLLEKNKGSSVRVGSETIYRFPPDNAPTQLFLEDGIHPGTVLNGLFSNFIINALNAKIGTSIYPLTDADILSAAGL